MNNWQLCPKCNGQGTNYNNNAITTSCICDLCNGHKVISAFTGKPPQSVSIQEFKPNPFFKETQDTTRG